MSTTIDFESAKATLQGMGYKMLSRRQVGSNVIAARLYSNEGSTVSFTNIPLHQVHAHKEVRKWVAEHEIIRYGKTQNDVVQFIY